MPILLTSISLSEHWDIKNRIHLVARHSNGVKAKPLRMNMTLTPSGMNQTVDEVRNTLNKLRANDPDNVDKVQNEMAKLEEVIESFHKYKKTNLDLGTALRDVELAADALDNIWRDDSPEEARAFIDDALGKLSAFSVPFSEQEAHAALRDLEHRFMEQEAEEFFDEFDSIDEARGR